MVLEYGEGTVTGRDGRLQGYLCCEKMVLGTCKLCPSNASGLGGSRRRCSQEPANSQMVEEAVGRCLSLFPGLAAFTGADTARATLAYTKQKLIWEKSDLCHEGGETLPMFPVGSLTDRGIAGNP